MDESQLFKRNSLKDRLLDQLFGNFTSFEAFYIASLLWIQVIVYILVPDTDLGIICGITGILAVVLGMKGRKINFLFGIIQCATMALIAYQSHTYGYFAMSLVYLVSMPIGFILWGKTSDEAVYQLSKNKMILLGLTALVSWFVCSLVLAQFDEQQMPYFDSLNLVIPLIAQALYILKYRENWILWIITNIVAVSYWVTISIQVFYGITDEATFGAALSQVALQGALLFNSIYALFVWNRYSRNKNLVEGLPR